MKNPKEMENPKEGGKKNRIESRNIIG